MWWSMLYLIQVYLGLSWSWSSMSWSYLDIDQVCPKTYLFWMDTTFLGRSGRHPFSDGLAVVRRSDRRPPSSGHVPRGYRDCVPRGGSYFFVFFAIARSRSRIFRDPRDRVIFYVFFAIHAKAFTYFSRSTRSRYFVRWDSSDRTILQVQGSNPGPCRT